MESIEDNVLSIIDLYVERYNMNDSAIIVYPGYNDIIVYEGCNSNGSTSLPEGGGPGYYLTKNSNGDLIWKMLDNCLTWKEFTTGPSETNPVPYEFVLDTSPASIFQVHINGQLIKRSSYTHSGYSVFIDAPTILDNAVVTIFGACNSLTIHESNSDEENNFTWNEGESYTFTTLKNIKKVKDVYINGQRILNNQDYIYSIGTSEFTVIDSSIILEENDEVDIIFIPFIGDSPTEPTTETTFDITFDETFTG